MGILKCLVGFADGCVATCDGIAHQGKLWLVPEWLAHPTEGHSKPARIIRFDNFPHQPGVGGVDYQNILLPIPESALHGDMPPGIEYEDLPPNLFVATHELRQQ